MTDLNYPLEDKSNEEIANYLGCSEMEVKAAKAEGATTYSEVYRYTKRQEEIREEKQRVLDKAEGRKPKKKKPGKSNGPWGRSYFK